jgi:hypothetical protein
LNYLVAVYQLPDSQGLVVTHAQAVPENHDNDTARKRKNNYLTLSRLALKSHGFLFFASLPAVRRDGKRVDDEQVAFQAHDLAARVHLSAAKSLVK